MKTITTSFYFPNDLYKLRSLKVRANKEVLGKIRYAEERSFEFPENTDHLFFNIGFHKAVLNLDKVKDKDYALIYFDLRNSLDIYKFNILRVKHFRTIEERNAFCNTLYVDFGKSKTIKPTNKTVILLGCVISAILALSSFYPDSSANGGFNLTFFMGIGSLVSMLILNTEKNIRLKDYKTRITATLLIFVLSLFIIHSNTMIAIIAILSMVFFIRSIAEFKRLDSVLR